MRLILLFTPALLSACIWIYGTTIDGESQQTGIGPANILNHSLVQTPREHFASLYHKAERSDEDEAVRLIFEGNITGAILRLRTIEEKNPGRYSVAANLGTAYELNAQDEDALKWIREGIRRDAEAHRGTEWLHVVILKRKLQMRQRPDLLNETPMIPLPATFTENSTITIDDQTITIADLVQALHYQLHERMIFVKPEDPVVADLLYTYALVTAQTRVLEQAIELLDLASRYDPDKKGLQTLKAAYEEKTKAFHWRELAEYLLPFLLLVTALVLTLVLIVKSIVRTFKWITFRRRG